VAWTDEAERTFDQVMRSGNSAAAEMFQAMRSFPRERRDGLSMHDGRGMMAVRLLKLQRVLHAHLGSPTFPMREMAERGSPRPLRALAMTVKERL
jgi:hypothetical protein